MRYPSSYANAAAQPGVRPGRSLLAPPALYAVAAVRVVFGALLIAVAPASRAPMALRVLGGFIVIAGLFTPFVSVERFGGVVAALSERLWLIRGIAFVPLLLGLLLAYAINSDRRRPICVTPHTN